jgi:hypothetical protein
MCTNNMPARLCEVRYIEIKFNSGSALYSSLRALSICEGNDLIFDIRLLTCLTFTVYQSPRHIYWDVSIPR